MNSALASLWNQEAHDNDIEYRCDWEQVSFVHVPEILKIGVPVNHTSG